MKNIVLLGLCFTLGLNSLSFSSDALRQSSRFQPASNFSPAPLLIYPIYARYYQSFKERSAPGKILRFKAASIFLVAAFAFLETWLFLALPAEHGPSWFVFFSGSVIFSLAHWPAAIGDTFRYERHLLGTKTYWQKLGLQSVILAVLGGAFANIFTAIPSTAAAFVAVSCLHFIMAAVGVIRLWRVPETSDREEQAPLRQEEFLAMPVLDLGMMDDNFSLMKRQLTLYQGYWLNNFLALSGQYSIERTRDFPRAIAAFLVARLMTLHLSFSRQNQAEANSVIRYYSQATNYHLTALTLHELNQELYAAVVSLEDFYSSH
jgi:hypothetical protein